MCWMTTEEKYMKPIVAKKDKVVYKVMKYHSASDIETPYRVMNCDFGKIYEESRFTEEIKSWCKTYGFHSFDPKKTRVKKEKQQKRELNYEFPSHGTIWIISWSFKKWLFFPDLFNLNDYWDMHPSLIIVKCTIPKGSTYFVNENGEVISQAIRYENDFVFLNRPFKKIKRFVSRLRF